MSDRFRRDQPESARRRLLCGLAAMPVAALIPSDSRALDAGALCCDDPWSNNMRRSIDLGTPQSAGALSACVNPARRLYSVAYRDGSGRLYCLWRSMDAAESCDRGGAEDLFANILRDTGVTATPAQGNPFIYVGGRENREIVLYRDTQNRIRGIHSSNRFGVDNLSRLSRTQDAQPAAGNPVGFYRAAFDDNHVIYRGDDNHLHLLYWVGEQPVTYGGNLTAASPCFRERPARGDPSAYANAAGTNIVIYRDDNSHIMSVAWSEGCSELGDLSGVAGAPRAINDPIAYYTASMDTNQVVYVGDDAHIWELHWRGSARVERRNLTQESGAPPLRWGRGPVPDPVAYYSAATNTKHVVYRARDGRMIDIQWTPGGDPSYTDLSAPPVGAYLSWGRPAGFETVAANSSAQHVAYSFYSRFAFPREYNGHVFEVLKEAPAMAQQLQGQFLQFPLGIVRTQE